VTGLYPATSPALVADRGVAHVVGALLVRAASYIGTQSWAEYGQVVLQMAILDTLLSIEEKLDRLAGREDA
jgi:hypothetical protein